MDQLVDRYSGNFGVYSYRLLMNRVFVQRLKSDEDKGVKKNT